ncbi:MAG: hypothetical protein KC609_17635 [Myxococcales bacterium]|nr:hypothetical protein [Myxococcales bacterium]
MRRFQLPVLLALFALLSTQSAFFCGPPPEGIDLGESGYGDGPTPGSGVPDWRGIYRSTTNELTKDECKSIGLSDPFAGKTIEIKVVQEKTKLEGVVNEVVGSELGDEKVIVRGEMGDGGKLKLTTSVVNSQDLVQQGHAIRRVIRSDFVLDGTLQDARIDARWLVTVTIQTTIITATETVQCKIEASFSATRTTKPD